MPNYHSPAIKVEMQKNLRPKKVTNLVHSSILSANNIGSPNITSGGELHSFLCHRYHNCKNRHYPHNEHSEFLIRPYFLRYKLFLRATLTMDMMRKQNTSITNGAKVLANPCKFSWWHPNDGLELCFRDSKMLTVYVHQLHLKVGNLVLSFMPRIRSKQSTKQP